MFCHKCGSKLPEESEFCHKCGEKVVCENTAEQTSAEPTPAITDQKNLSVNLSGIVYYKECPDVPDFGATIGVPLLRIENNSDSSVLDIAYIYNKSDVEMNGINNYKKIAEAEGFAYEEHDNTSSSHTFTHGNRTMQVSFFNESDECFFQIFEENPQQTNYSPGLTPTTTVSPASRKKIWPSVLGAVGFILVVIIIASNIMAGRNGGKDGGSSDSVSGNRSNRIVIGETQTYDKSDIGLGIMEVTLEYIEFVNRTPMMGWSSPDSGNTYMRTEWTINNIGTTSATFYPDWGKVVYDDTYEFTKSVSDLNFANIAPLSPSGTTTGYFEVPNIVAESDKALAIIFTEYSWTSGAEEVVMSYVIRPGATGAGQPLQETRQNETPSTTTAVGSRTSATNSNTSELTYNETPVFNEMSMSDIIDILGTPLYQESYGENSRYDYDGIHFWVNIIYVKNQTKK